MAKLTETARAERRDVIVSAATTKFAAQGFHATSMAEVISESGLAAGTVYQYFASKDDLIVATAQRALDGIGTAVTIGISSRQSKPATRYCEANVRAAQCR